MPQVRSDLGWWGWGFVATLVLIGCGGQAEANKRGTAETSSGDAAGHPNTSGGSGGAAPIAPGGTSSGSAGSNGSVAPCLSAKLPQCSAEARIDARAKVYDPVEIAKEGTNGKVRVTVTKVEQQFSEAAETLATPLWRNYQLRSADRAWMVDATIPGLTSELIQEGDELDFQLETSLGFVPLTQSYDQVFGLFTLEGDLLLFGAHQAGYAPLPDLSFLGLEVSDAGVSCVVDAAYAGCSFDAHRAHFRTREDELNVEPASTAQLGNLLVSVEAFQAINECSAGSCDSSGRSGMFGVKIPAKNAQ